MSYPFPYFSFPTLLCSILSNLVLSYAILSYAKFFSILPCKGSCKIKLKQIVDSLMADIAQGMSPLMQRYVKVRLHCD